MQESPQFPLISRDGVEFDLSGVTFEITHRVGEDETIVPIVLRDVLVGLNMKPSAEGKRSQAEVFASFAVQRGFSSEDQILDRFRDVSPRQNRETKEWFSTSRRLIDIWKAEVEEERNRRATATMAEKAVPISVGQRTEANRLLPLLAEHEGGRLRSQLLDLLQVDEEDPDEGPQGAKMSRTIGRARAFLGLRADSPPQFTSPPNSESRPTTMPESSSSMVQSESESSTENAKDPF